MTLLLTPLVQRDTGIKLILKPCSRDAWGEQQTQQTQQTPCSSRWCYTTHRWSALSHHQDQKCVSHVTAPVVVFWRGFKIHLCTFHNGVLLMSASGCVVWTGGHGGGGGSRAERQGGGGCDCQFSTDWGLFVGKLSSPEKQSLPVSTMEETRIQCWAGINHHISDTVILHNFTVW